MTPTRRILAASLAGLVVSSTGVLAGAVMCGASAVSVSQNVEEVTIGLTSNDVRFVHASGAPALCTFEVLPPLEGFITVDLTYTRCIKVLEYCAGQDAAEAPLEVRVTDDAVECLVRAW